MLLFRLADLPRRVRRLVPGLPLSPDRDEQQTLVTWTLAPLLLDTQSRRMQGRVKRVLALYAATEGRPRSQVEALAPEIEELWGDYRLARCLTRTVEELGYTFVSPPPALPHAPSALRALCYQRAQQMHGGYVPRAERGAFLAALAADLETTPALLEEMLWSDRAGAALLQREHGATVLHPARVIARYNAAAVSTVIAASSWATLQLATSETAALKDLYRCARALHVGVEIAHSAMEDSLDVTLYGPGSRALVRGRAAVVESPGAAAPSENVAETSLNVELAPEGAADESATGAPGGVEVDEDAAAEPGGVDSSDGVGVRVPAPGGSPVAAVVTRLARLHAGALLGGWTRLLGPADRRLYHVALERDLLAALRGADKDDFAAEEATVRYDSAVEEDFARAFQAHELAGRGGLARGWTLHREPRIIVAGATVFLPDFAFRRGDVEVYAEVIGYYTEDYLERKIRKLAALRGAIPLLLIVDQDLAPLFVATGFPVVTYRARRVISVTDVLATLEDVFDPFARRRGRGRSVLARLCATVGPLVGEEELAVATGCAGRSELLALWADVLAGPPAPTARTPQWDERRVAEEREFYEAGDSMGLARRYLPGYGLAPARTLAEARAALAQLLREAGGSVSLEQALACITRAGLPDPDEALLERLGAVVARADLFDDARVYAPSETGVAPA